MREALFSIPYHWLPTTLGEACKRGGGDIQTGPFGSQLHAADYVPAGIPSIMPQNIGDNRISEDGIARITDEDAQRLSRYLVRPGDIVYSRRGDVERRALIRDHEDGCSRKYSRCAASPAPFGRLSPLQCRPRSRNGMMRPYAGEPIHA